MNAPESMNKPDITNAPAATAAPVRRKAKGGFIAAVVVLAGVFSWLIWGGLDSNVVYFLEPHELLAKGTSGMNVPVRLGGQVRPGSVQWTETTSDLQFDITDTTGMVIHVKSTGVPPQMFREGMGVVVHGQFSSDSVFHSSELLIKHSNEYRPPKEGEEPKTMYKSLLKGSGT